MDHNQVNLTIQYKYIILREIEKDGENFLVIGRLTFNLSH